MTLPCARYTALRDPLAYHHVDSGPPPPRGPVRSVALRGPPLAWSPSRLIPWGEKTGPATGRVVSEILRRYPHPEQGYRSCLGLLRLSKRYGPERLEAACIRAERLGSPRYQTAKNILASGSDRLALEDDSASTPPLPLHENVRGPGYYAGEEETKC